MPYIRLLTGFWVNHPALFHGMALLFGAYCHHHGSVVLVIPITCLWIPILGQMLHKRTEVLKIFSINVLVFLTGLVYAASQTTYPDINAYDIQGNGLIKIKSINLQSTIFGERWIYKCHLQQFRSISDHTVLCHSAPCRIIFPTEQTLSNPRPLAECDYLVVGKLIHSANGGDILKISAKKTWEKVPWTWSAAEMRYYYKQKLNKWIHAHVNKPLSASFLSGLATGDFDDHWMRQQFARFGLQHLLAISGFHFSIIANFLNFILRLIFSRQLRIFSLISALTGYCLFLGPQASVIRTWLMCCLALSGELLLKNTTPLNSLGCALMAIIWYDPLLCEELGFQLSFAATTAILLFYQPSQAFINYFIPRKELSDVISMDVWSQHGQCVLSFVQRGLALTLAVNLVILPISLYYFHEFPIMGLLYNLFFPLLASISLGLLIIGMLTSWIPWLGSIIYVINDHYTHFIIQLTYQMPNAVDMYLNVGAVQLQWLLCYLCFMSVIAIFWKQRNSNESTNIFGLI